MGLTSPALVVVLAVVAAAALAAILWYWPRLVGRGVMPVGEIFAELAKMRYPGYVDLEYEIHGDDPMPGVTESMAYMRGVMAGMGWTS